MEKKYAEKWEDAPFSQRARACARVDTLGGKKIRCHVKIYPYRSETLNSRDGRPRPPPRPPSPENIGGRGVKYDYWICQKQLRHEHLLAGREIKLREIVTIGIIFQEGYARVLTAYRVAFNAARTKIVRHD